MEEKKITVPDAAKICAVSRWTLLSYVKSGELKTTRTPGGHYRVNLKDLDEFMLKKGMKAQNGKVPSIVKILVVDDDPKIRKFLLKVLSNNMNEIAEAADGFEAGQKTITFKPDIMIVDIFMPKIDGFEVCRQMKKRPETTNTKIIAISGYDTEENRKKILSAGADLFIPKPLSKKIILDALKKLDGSSLNPDFASPGWVRSR